MASDKTADYYFGGLPVLERAPEENEWDGSVTDESLLQPLSLVPSFWRNVWLSVAANGKLDIEEKDNYLSIMLTVDNYDKSLYPNARALQNSFWSYDITSAKRKGWDWSGDTD